MRKDGLKAVRELVDARTDLEYVFIYFITPVRLGLIVLSFKTAIC